MNLNETLKIVPNPNCHKGCNQEKRDEIIENELCNDAVSVIDQLPIRCVGEWSIHKIYMLVQYFGIFSQGMKKKWNGKLNYIEICCGPGRCINRKIGEEFNGTALAIIEHSACHYLGKVLFFDSNEKVVTALNQRIELRGIRNARALLGDYYNDSDICMKIGQEVHPNGLNLVFIDPTDCSVPFQLVKSIKKKLSNTDLIINLASMTDFNRNVGNALLNPEKYSKLINKYNRFLDHAGFFNDIENLELAQQKNFLELRRKFRTTYTENLKRLGYQYFDFTSVNGFYDILFATGHEKGLEFWEKAQKIGYDGQRKLF
ncbi:MAG: three-Cys-motif partner protein TcmP [Bacteroidetes bacterium]|nr:three-Cys-motif partner protein TcmP [Bacteroidota bacterium]